MPWLTLLLSCDAVDPSGHPFAPAADALSEVAAAPVVADPRFAPAAAPFAISSEEMAANADPADVTPTVTQPDSVAPAAPVVSAADAPTLPAVSAASGFPVRLLSTLPNAQPPRAVLGLPSGAEVVVSPGTVLGPEGIVVMTVMAGRVQLAAVHAAGDHATIESIELSAQYP